MPSESSAPDPANRSPRFRARWLWLLALAPVIAIAAAPAFRMQDYWEKRTTCQSNLRRLSTALLLYAQDHDGYLPPTESFQYGRWRPWTDLADPYKRGQNIEECPANPAKGAHHATLGYPYDCSYALNYRFLGVFSSGPFAAENVEIPAQTALLVEAGWRRDRGPFGPPAKPLAMSAYFDTGQMPEAYPSPHDRRIDLAAIDSHTASVTVAHYSRDRHDPLYGRLGGSIYNWNGGHPNGDTAGPPRE